MRGDEGLRGVDLLCASSASIRPVGLSDYRRQQRCFPAAGTRLLSLPADKAAPVPLTCEHTMLTPRARNRDHCRRTGHPLCLSTATKRPLSVSRTGHLLSSSPHCHPGRQAIVISIICKKVPMEATKIKYDKVATPFVILAAFVLL